MKTLTGIILLFAVVLLSACEGPVGPRGPEGPEGVPGESLIGSIFEIEDDFTPDNNYQLYFEFPSSVTVYDTDIVLVYILWEQATDNNNEPLDVWRLLPQTVVLDEGVLQYNYDYTLNDVQIFLEGTVPFNTLLPAETENQVFRIAVLPADFAKNNSVDISNLNLVMKSLEITPNSITKLK